MGTVVLLVGPKGVGKSWVATTIEKSLGVRYIDADELILDLLERGEAPDDVVGWLVPIEAAVCRALENHSTVSIEATGAWESDYLLGEHLEQAGHRVLRVRLTAPEHVTLARLAARSSRKAPVTEAEASWIYRASAANADTHLWDLTLDLAGDATPTRVTEALATALLSPT